MNLRILPIALAAIALAALGGGPASGAPSPETATAKTALIRATDVPANLSHRSVDNRDDNTSLGTGAECRRYDKVKNEVRRARTGRANVTFADATGNEKVAEAVGLTKKAGSAKKLADAFADPGTGQCLERFLEKSLRQSLGSAASGVSLTVEPSTLPKLGDQRSGYDVLVKVPNGNGIQNVAFSFVTIRKGRALALFEFQTLSGDLVTERDAVLAAGARRLKAAVG
ncbi:MAG: hypothetical protein U0V73_14980 [Acidimicrobiia bacterium]